MSILDKPIKNKTEDTLNRYLIVKEISKELATTDVSEGLVLGITGSWGSGKSSFLNLLETEIKNNQRGKILRFNPWHLSNENSSLVVIFWREMTLNFKKLLNKKRYKEIGTAFRDYGETLINTQLPFPLPVNIMKTLLGMKKISQAPALDQYNDLVNSFRELDYPIYIFVDDVDRLDSEEIKELFKLLRQTANFPNLIYVIAFDKILVSKALDNERDQIGESYVNKIIQYEISLPETPFEELENYLLSYPNIKNKLTVEGKKRWDTVREELGDRISTFRDVKRIIRSVDHHLQIHQDNIDILDLVTLEILRLTSPRFFSEIKKNYYIFSLLSSHRFYKAWEWYTKLEDMRKVNKDFRLENIVDFLFPGTKQFLMETSQSVIERTSSSQILNTYRKERRIADYDTAHRYFTVMITDNLNYFYKIAPVMEMMENDPDKFKEELDSMTLEETYRLCGALVRKEHGYSENSAIILPIFLNKASDLFESDSSLVFHSHLEINIKTVLREIRSVIWMMLTQMENDRQEVQILEIIKNIKEVSSKNALALHLGIREDAEKWNLLEDTYRDAITQEILSATIEDYSREWSLIQYGFTKVKKSNWRLRPENSQALFSIIKENSNLDLKGDVKISWTDILDLYENRTSLSQAVDNLTNLQTKYDESFIPWFNQVKSNFDIFYQNIQ